MLADMSKKSSVPVQKGPIIPVEYTYKFMPRDEMAKQDAENERMRFYGMKMELKTPKK
jgi:hypothetical protein